ncbi:MAG: Hsp20/alpha crystallin family protein [Patescibacteria group bacterium]|nr:Hsp20/alpha crystallin family protein [Patescibacteria group bacterium]
MKSSFFEKIKKGMGVEELIEEEKTKPVKAKREETEKEEKTKEPEIKTLPVELEEKDNSVKEKAKIKKPPAKKPPVSVSAPVDKKTEDKLPEPEGQLAIDIYQTDLDLVIRSAIAGVKVKDLDLSIEEDLLTIRGERKRPDKEEGDYFSQECYWGPFSREIILPVEIDPGRVEATLKEGVLIIRIPKILRENKRKIVIKG